MRLDVAEPYALSGEFFRWEIATAVAGAVMEINPFDQPDVEASKIETRKLTSDYEATGHLPEESAAVRESGMALFTDRANQEQLAAAAAAPTAEARLRAHLARLGAGDYFALLAYIPMTHEHEALLSRLRHRVRDHWQVATCLGFGPRFPLDGQAYKAAPTAASSCRSPATMSATSPCLARYTFGVVKAAQARGDFQVLVDRHRRALRVHLAPTSARGSSRSTISSRRHWRACARSP